MLHSRCEHARNECITKKEDHILKDYVTTTLAEYSGLSEVIYQLCICKRSANLFGMHPNTVKGLNMEGIIN
jgi:hypothetical protein